MTHGETEKKLPLMKELDGAIMDRSDRVFKWTMLISTFIHFCACVAIAYTARCDRVMTVYCAAYVVIAGVHGYRKGHEGYVRDCYRGVVNGWPLGYSERDAKKSAEDMMSVYVFVGSLGALLIWIAAMATYSFIV